MRKWNHYVILFRSISRFLSAVCRQLFPGHQEIERAEFRIKICYMFYAALPAIAK